MTMVRRTGPYADGYVRVYEPGHPLANAVGQVFEHRYVLHAAGIDLPPGAHVHHKNGDRADNRLENLEVLTPRDHANHHIAERGGVVVNQYGEHKRRVVHTCERCGRQYTRWYERTRFCSSECRYGLADSNRRNRPEGE